MKTNIYWKYFLYVLEHKWNVGCECIKMGLYIHAITHDLSKLHPSEFVPYAKFFHEKDRTNTYKQSDENNDNFQQGWCLHQKRNKHHWNFWVSVTRKNEIQPIPMPMKYVKQMVGDWRGMSRKFGGDTVEYFQNNRDSMILHPDTVRRIESSKPTEQSDVIGLPTAGRELVVQQTRSLSNRDLLHYRREGTPADAYAPSVLAHQSRL